MVVKFVGLSQTCQTLCLNIIEALVEVCGPREMFTAFMEVFQAKHFVLRVRSSEQ